MPTVKYLYDFGGVGIMASDLSLVDDACVEAPIFFPQMTATCHFIKKEREKIGSSNLICSFH